MPLLLVWAVPGVLGLVLALTLGRTWGRIGALVVMGLVLGLAWLAVAYFAATPSDQPRDCSDCYESFGRWWEPNWALFVIGVSCALWALGVLVGAALRRGRA